MERITSLRYSEPYADATTWLPKRLRPLVASDVFCGDPVFAGLHGTEQTTDGRSYRDTAHVCYPHHVRDRRVTVVFPEPPSWYTAIHEMGHVLDWTLRTRTGRLLNFQPVTDYARMNRREAFAEAFTAWFYPAGFDHFKHDVASREFFDRLAYGGW